MAAGQLVSSFGARPTLCLAFFEGLSDFRLKGWYLLTIGDSFFSQRHGLHCDARRAVWKLGNAPRVQGWWKSSGSASQTRTRPARSTCSRPKRLKHASARNLWRTVLPRFTPHVLLFGVVPIHRCVLPYTYRKVLQTAFKLMNTLWFNNGFAGPHPTSRDHCGTNPPTDITMPLVTMPLVTTAARTRQPVNGHQRTSPASEHAL